MRVTFGSAFVLCSGLAAFVAMVAAPAAANNTGIFGKSGRDAEGGTCTQCHVGDNGPVPTVTVKGLEDTLTAGGFADITITVKTNDDSGGIAEAACPDRCAGINAAVDPGVGTFVVPGGSALIANAARTEISHIAKSAFVDGEVEYRMALSGLAEGEHTLYVAANDVDGQAEFGDRTKTLTVDFKVGAATANDPDGTDEDAGGCAQAAGAPLWLVAGALLARRRRA